MKSKVIKTVAIVASLACSERPLWAQSEEETTIEFAPDDELIEEHSQRAPLPNLPAGASTMGPPRPNTLKRERIMGPWGPPAPNKTPDSSMTAETRPTTERKSGSRVFGRYRIRVGAANPTFTENLKYYKELYGSPSVYPVFGADWFAWDWYITFGISLKTGFYTADGRAVKPTGSRSDISPDNLTKDTTSSTVLTLIPTQLALAAEFTPFPQKWLVVDGWYGAERLYFQEVRSGAQTKTGQSLLSPLAVGSTDDALTNKGFKSSMVSGVAVNILLNALDEQSSQSMRGSMGLASIYLSPYVEFVRQSSSGVDFSRVNRGITFTFETIY